MSRIRSFLLLALAPILLSGCLSKLVGASEALPYAPGEEIERGIASWYGPGYEGNLTASGEPFDPDGITAAHKSLPFGTRVKVVHLDNGQEIIVRINDRGPFLPGRIIDLSRGAAQRIGLIDQGIADVKLIFVD